MFFREVLWNFVRIISDIVRCDLIQGWLIIDQSLKIMTNLSVLCLPVFRYFVYKVQVEGVCVYWLRCLTRCK